FALSAGGSALSGLAVVAAVGLGAIIGGTIAGRKAGTTSAPGAILAALQAALGLAAILGVILFRAARAAYLVVWPILGGTALGAWGLRFGLALSLLTLAASCFFAMPPMLARLIVAGRQGLGIACGFTFGLSLAGLALGLFAGGLVFLPELGIHGSLLIGVALSGLAAGGTILLRQRGLEGPGAIGANLSAGELPAGKAEDDDTLIDEEIIAGAALAAANILVGFCIWTYLQAWTRTLTFVVGGTAQAKAVVAAVFLLGLAVGAFLVAGVVERLGRLMLLLTLLLTASSIVACASMHFLEPAVVFYLRLTPLLARPALSFLAAALTAAAVMMPSCLLLGGALPLLPLAARQRGRPMAGTLAFLAVGVFLADLAVGLFIVPAFGLRRTVSLAGAIGLLAALLFLGGIPFRRRDLRTTVAIALLGLMVVLGAFPATWDPRIVAAGPYRYGASMLKRYGTAEQYLAARRGVEVLYYHEGRNASVMVERTLQKAPSGPPVENLALSVDGKIEATTGDDIRAQVLQAHVPILVHGPTHSILLVDFLNGVTAGSILRHPVGSLTILEREPALFDAAEDFGDYNRKPLGDSRAVRIVDAPRARLLADPTAYDVIIVSSIDPWLPHGASLVTVEGCQLLKSRLRPGGLVAQRVPLASAPEPALKTALRTFASVFESFLVFQVSPEDLLILGSTDPLALDVGWLRNVLGSNASVAQDLARVIPLGANGILLEFRMGGDGLRGLVGDGPLNDDDRSPVEALASRRLSLHDNDALLRRVNGAWAGITPFLKNYGALPQEQADFLYNLAKAYLGVVADPVRARGIARDLSALGRASMARWVTGECLLQ
ncbi:MAG TPA: hypothetical protein VJ144_01555, partial [Candidatus Polarisedimenticolia bacterium]|nr:hypothetical protein [Candidatus Polarisedimenticolia bacterium]